MNTDLYVLSSRIQAIENQLGIRPASKQNETIQTSIQQCLTSLRQQVPDEIAAAKRAVTMLSHAAPRLPSAARLRRTEASSLEQTVDETILLLDEMQRLVKEMDDVDLSQVARNAPRVEQLQSTLLTQLAPGIDREDAQLDKLLIDFNDSTARLNHHLISLAATMHE